MDDEFALHLHFYFCPFLWNLILFTFVIVILALAVTSVIESISGVWEFIMECGAGLGLLLMMRWFWFRINAWAEIAATEAISSMLSMVTAISRTALESAL